jgi:hypothetical protein
MANRPSEQAVADRSSAVEPDLSEAAMTRSKHPRSGHAPAVLPRDDLKDNPGIGSSKGTTISGEEPEVLEGENTYEGDVENDADATGAPTAQRRHRTNR